MTHLSDICSGILAKLNTEPGWLLEGTQECLASVLHYHPGHWASVHLVRRGASDTGRW